MIDFHCHLDLYQDPQGVARECADRGLYVLSVTTTPSAWQGTSAIAADAPHIRTSLGLHPQIAHERVGELGLFDGLLPKARYVGEIGLDGGPEYKAYWPLQLRVFRHILGACSAAGGRVMSMHSRRATSAVLDEIEAHPAAGRAVLHWFAGTQRDLKRAVDLGCWFSVGPLMLGSAKGKALAKAMPHDRVLTETDGPFARGPDGSPLMPWDAEKAVPLLSAVWEETIESVQAKLRNNLRSLVRDIT